MMFLQRELPKKQICKLKNQKVPVLITSGRNKKPESPRAMVGVEGLAVAMAATSSEPGGGRAGGGGDDGGEGGVTARRPVCGRRPCRPPKSPPSRPPSVPHPLPPDEESRDAWPSTCAA